MVVRLRARRTVSLVKLMQMSMSGNLTQAQTTFCGFPVVPEREAISLPEDKVAEFSLPQEALSWTARPANAFARFPNGERERRVHCNIDLESDELERLGALQDDVRKQDLALLPSVAVAATRYLNSAPAASISAVLEDMLATQEWRLTYFASGPLTEAVVAQDVGRGAVYFGGRDRALRPALVVRLARIPREWWYKGKGVSRLIRVLVFCMEYFLRFMAMPGKVEVISVIVDLRGANFGHISMQALAELNKVLSSHYKSRVCKIYICNAPALVGVLAATARRLLSERQRQKVATLDRVEQLREDFALHQLEEDLGGTRPMATTFLPFPLPPGPFEAGRQDGGDAHATPRVHQAFTPEGFRGEIWSAAASADRARTRQEAARYTDAAERIFRSCGVGVPEELALVDREAPARQVRRASCPADLHFTTGCRGIGFGDAGEVRTATV